jgi:hypothetical protein
MQGKGWREKGKNELREMDTEAALAAWIPAARFGTPS